jgi:hypothetical protein
MGLDMYAYAAERAGQYQEFWETAEMAEGAGNEYQSKTVARPREIAYWRKHPGLHGWFKAEWESEGNEGSFNGDELEITWDMLERLEYDVRNGELPQTKGFFFGNPADEEYLMDDLEFIKNARTELFMGLKVFYNSSW